MFRVVCANRCDPAVLQRLGISPFGCQEERQFDGVLRHPRRDRRIERPPLVESPKLPHPEIHECNDGDHHQYHAADPDARLHERVAGGQDTEPRRDSCDRTRA